MQRLIPPHHELHVRPMTVRIRDGDAIPGRTRPALRREGGVPRSELGVVTDRESVLLRRAAARACPIRCGAMKPRR
jgi:hypothetical protein